MNAFFGLFHLYWKAAAVMRNRTRAGETVNELLEFTGKVRIYKGVILTYY